MADEMGQIWRNITIRKAEYLREFANGRTEREAAAALGVTFEGARSAVEDLKSTTGCGSVRDLGRFWRERRDAWLEFCAVAGGIGT